MTRASTTTRANAGHAPRGRSARTCGPLGLRSIVVVLLSVLALATPASSLAAWTSVTSPGTNTTLNPISELAWDGSRLWIASNTEGSGVMVKHWDGTTWTTLPQPQVDTYLRNKMPSITWDGSSIWVAWNDDNDDVQVRRWTGSAWTSVASPGGNTGSVYTTPDIFAAGSTVHVAFQDASRNVIVRSWNGSAWNTVGTTAGSGGTTNAYPNLAWDGSRLWVIHNDAANSAQVRYYDGSAWAAHSTATSGIGFNTVPSLRFIAGRMYASTEGPGHAALLKFWNGQAWISAPGPGGAQGSFAYPNLEWDGTRLWSARTIDPVTIRVEYETPIAPGAPTSLLQHEADGTTAITSGAWSSSGDATNLLLRATTADASGGETLTPWVELQPQGTAFGATCGLWTGATTRAGAPVAAPSAGVGVAGTVALSGLANGASYVWRTCTVDQYGFPGPWTPRGSLPDFRVDYSVPTAAMTTPLVNATVTQTPTLSATYTDPAPANSGRLEFRACGDSACTSVLQSGSVTGLASGTSGSWTSPTLTPGSRWWQVRSVDIVGNASGWTTPRAMTVGSSLAISGNAYVDEAATPTVWAQCDGSTPNIAATIDGGGKVTTSCSATTGAFSFGVTAALADRVIAIYMEPTTPGDRGVTYTRNVDTTTAIGGVRLTRGRTWLRSESGTVISNAAIDVYDSAQDADIPATSDGRSLTLPAGTELHVGAGVTYEPGAVTQSVTSLHVAGRYVGGPFELLTLTGAGTGTCTAGPGVARPLCVDAGGAFLPDVRHRTRFTSAASVAVEATTYGRLELQPAAAGSPTYVLGSAAAGSIGAARLTVGDGANPLTVSTAAFSPTVRVDGDLVVNAGATLLGTGTGTVTVSGSATGAGTVTMPTSPFRHEPAAASASLGTTSGAAAWSFGSATVADHRPTTWGTGGAVAYNSPGTANDRVNSAVRDAQGNLYVGGFETTTTSQDYLVRRYTPAGGLDTGWGDAGSVRYSSPGAFEDVVWDLAVDGKGALYVAGTLNVNGAGGSDWGLRRYTPTGALDTSFGTGGMVTWDDGGGSNDVLAQVVVDAAGNVYAGGKRSSNGIDWVVRRYTSSGTLDTGWAGGGMVTYNSAGTAEDQLTSLAITPTGDLLAGGYRAGTGFDWVVRRYGPTGLLDTGWAGSGTLVWSTPGSANDVIAVGGLTVDEAGNVYASGYQGTNATDLAVRKYDTTGTIVSGWGTSGMVTYNSGGGQDAAYEVALDAEGRLLVTGYQQTNGFDWVLLRYTEGGILDTTFGGGAGRVTYTTTGATADAPRSVIVDPSGAITVAGYSALNGGEWMVRRYDAGGNLADGAAGFPSSSVAAVGGTGTTSVGTMLTVGAAGDPATTTLDLDSADRAWDIDGSVTIAATGVLRAASAAVLTIADDFTNQGSFVSNGGTTTFDTAATSTLTYAAPTSFGGLAVSTPGKVMQFDDADATSVTGALTVNGGACGTTIALTSAAAPAQFELNATGAKSVQYATIGDSNALTATSASTSFSAGNTAGWSISTGVCASLTLTVDGASRSLGAVLSGTDATATSVVSVSTTNATGYQLAASDGTAGAGMTCSCGTIPEWTGTSAAPSAWTAGTTGGFGLSVLAATGGRLDKWGTTSGGPFAATNFSDNLYIGLGATQSVLHDRTTPGGGTDTITTAYRANAPAGTAAGTYSATITYSATANP